MTLTMDDKLALFEESGEHFIDLLERKGHPHNKKQHIQLIRQNIMKVRNDLQTASNERIRFNYGERGWSRRSLTGNRPATHARRIQLWLKNAALNFGCAALICLGVVSMSLFAG